MAAKRSKSSAAKAAKKPAPPEELGFRPFKELGEKAQKARKAEKKAAAEGAGSSAAKTGAAKPAAARKSVAPPPRAEAGGEASDAETFARYMAGVKPLRGEAQRLPQTAEKVERRERVAPAVDLDVEARAAMRALVAEGVRFETTDDGERIEGRRLDVDPRELRRLRRGAFAVDGKLDLHGLGATDARQAVEAFVRKRALDGDKVVALVHGKGKHSPRQTAVLRGEIGAWLSQGRAARHVRAFATAPAEDGGGGVLLVLLAR